MYLKDHILYAQTNVSETERRVIKFISKPVNQSLVNDHLPIPVCKVFFFFFFSTNCNNCQLVKWWSFCFPLATDPCPVWQDFHIVNCKMSQITLKSTWSLILHLNIQKESFFYYYFSHVKVRLFIYLTTDGVKTAKLSRVFEKFNKLSFLGNDILMSFKRFEWSA